jgi:hypothetical protein
VTYAVVGCGDCATVWILQDSDDATAVCPTCGTEHQRHQLRSLATAQTRDAAAQQRSAILAARRDEADADLDEYRLQGDRATEPVVDDREYLDGLGLDGALVEELCGDDTATTSDSGTTTADSGTGPDVDVPVADRAQLRASADHTVEEPGVSLLNPGGQLGITGHAYRDVGPRTSEWLPEVVQDLIPETARLVQDLAHEHPLGVGPLDPKKSNGDVSTFIHEVLAGEVAQLDDADAPAGTVEEARSYLDAIGRYSLLWADDVYRVNRGFDGAEQFERAQRTLETTGTSHGQYNAGVEALRHSLCQLHGERLQPPALTFLLDGKEWTAADAESVRRALRAFDVLAEAFDVRLWMSPGVRQRVRRLTNNALDDDAPAWAERFGFLTESGTTSRRVLDADDARERVQRADDAWAFVDDHASQTGLLTTLAHLDADDARSVRAIKRDDAISYADASIDAYLSELEAADMVDIDRGHASNRVALTALGETAQDYVTPTGEVVHPDQSQLLGASYGHPSASHKCSVSRQDSGGDRYSPAERWMAETGDPREEGYVQWLGESSGPRELKPPNMHRRLSAGERVKGVNLVDSEILDWTDRNQAPNGDGRATYVSVFDDTVHLVTQWGGPAQTLARLCAGLLDNKMLSKALSIDAVGAEWELAHDGVGAFDNDLHDVLVRAQQIGWMSEDELAHYDNWRERIGGLRSTLLGKLGQIGDLDAGLRRELFLDLHGLLCSATHLYRAAGMDVTTTLRMPRVKELRDNPEAYEQFLNFMRFTATKQAGYEDENGFHSWYRMCVEDREQKLKARAASNVSDDPDPTADLTMSWVLTGPDISSIGDHVQSAIEQEASRLRERVDDGTESAAELNIPFATANSHGHIRGLVRETADRKGFHDGHRDDLDRLTRVLEAALSTSDRGPDPYLVADALDSLESRDKPWDSLDVHSIKRALTAIPAERLCPDLPPSASRMLAVLFASDEPLTRQDLIEATSESSYDRHHETLRAFFLVEETDDGFVATLEPWWSSTNDDRTPYHDPHPNPMAEFEGVETTQPQPPTRPKEIVLHVAGESGWLDIPPDDYYEYGKPETYWGDVLDELGLQGLQPILSALCDDCYERPAESYSDPSPVTIAGQRPTGDTQQANLANAVADD